MEKKKLQAKIRKVLKKEGGAAGMKALKKQTDSSEKDIKSAISDDEKVAQHPDKDYILAKGKIKISEEEIIDMIQEELKIVLDEKRKKRKKRKKKKSKKKKDDRCTRIAKRKYKVWPSAYASGAVVRCRAGKIWKGEK